jgi:hypothetical protein
MRTCRSDLNVYSHLVPLGWLVSRMLEGNFVICRVFVMQVYLSGGGVSLGEKSQGGRWGVQENGL